MNILLNNTVSALSTTDSRLNSATVNFTDKTAALYSSTVPSTSRLNTSDSVITTLLTSTQYMNGITSETPSDLPGYVGFLTAGLAILLYGTLFAPVKKFETGDGMFFQWILCIAIWMTGLVVQLIRKSPEFYSICMLGGFLWETGNICVVPIVKTIGLGLGLCIWGMTNLLSGWATGSCIAAASATIHYVLAFLLPVLRIIFCPIHWLLFHKKIVKIMISGERGMNPVALTIINPRKEGFSKAIVRKIAKFDRFGLFGVDKEILSNPAMNDAGVVLAVSSAVIFSLVKNNVDGSQDGEIEIVFTEESPLIKNAIPNIKQENDDIKPGAVEDGHSFVDKLSPTSKRLVGVGLSIVSGVMYAQLFTPAKYLQDHGKSKNGLDYVFSTFCGIIATSTLYFAVYAILKKNKPKIFPKVIIPGFISGTMWGVATSSWFVANKVLSNSVAFPIVTTGPAVVASILGVLVFKEITGRKNILVLVFGMAVTITGSVLSGLSF